MKIVSRERALLTGTHQCRVHCVCEPLARPVYCLALVLGMRNQSAAAGAM